MTEHFYREISNLKKKILSLGAMVEESVRNSVRAVVDLDIDVARTVLENDNHVDEREVEIEEDCLKILALHQPVAVDLRFIIAVLKINNDLERIGDLAYNIAERVLVLSKGTCGTREIEFDYEDMASKTQIMLKKALDSLVNLDAKLAREVLNSDDEIDELNRVAFKAGQNAIRHNVENLNCIMHLVLIPRHLERIADLATNIAEDVIYMIDGDIIRHGR
jgi:phosphate transport system protein